MQTGAKGEAYVVTAPDSNAAAGVVVIDMPVWRLGGEDFSRGLVKGMVENLPEGWSASDLRTSRVSIPLPQTLRYRAQLTSTAGDTLYQFGYLVAGRVAYVITTTASTEVEPASFREIVGSFKADSPTRPALVPAALAIGRPRSLLLVVLVAFLLVEVLVRVRSRDGPAPLTFTSRLLLLIGVTGILFLTQVEIRPAEAWDPVPYAIGSVTGTLLLAVGIAYLIFGRVAKRNWNKFARIFCLLSLVLPILTAAGRVNR
jgi:hypothetical protein